MTRYIAAAVALLLIGAVPAVPAAGAPGAGACCTPSECADVTSEAECSGLGGVFLPGADCADDPCAPGACCFELSCGQSDAYSCISNGRFFAGAGTTCLDDPCEAGVGACCFGETCGDLAPDECAATGGTWLGAGTSCATGPCGAGACCLADACLDRRRFECDALDGSFFPGEECAEDPCSPDDPCPADTLFSQAPDGPDDFEAGTSEASATFRRCEDFSGIPGPIEALTWWGLDLDHLGGGAWQECEETDPRFEIAFHEDAGGVPGAVVETYTVTASRVPLGIFYLGAELNEYAVALPEPIVLVHGWVSIVGLGDPECWFLWMSAGTGSSWCEGCLPEAQDFDLALCLRGPVGGVFGACCLDEAGACAEDVEIVECTAPGTRFLPGAACADLDPPCGVVIGACCFDDATCSIEVALDCAAAGGSWLGANSLCAQCPCLVPCPGEGVPEGEADCADGMIDSFNGGCIPPGSGVSPIALDTTVCGTGGVFELEGENVPDFDWYELTMARAGEVTLSATAQFRPQIWIVDGREGCPGVVLATAIAFECEAVSVTAAVEPGTLWLVIASAGFTDSAACGAQYRMTVSAVDACPGDIDGDGSVGFSDLLALLAAWGPCPGCPEDVDLSGDAGFADLLIILGAWGPCPE